MTTQNITSSFRATGVFPVNRQVLEILQVKEKGPAKLSMAAIGKTNGINFFATLQSQEVLNQLRCCSRVH